jgi:tRNA1(Val) A37 N6-methylase TrmN6
VDPSEDAPAGEPSTDDALTGRFRVFQLRGGHRYSVDDVLTAREALRAAPEAARVLDLGCGIGSVLLMEAHHLDEARFVGIEAQAVSFELAERNVARNELGGRVSVIHGDLREAAIRERARVAGGPFELISGTPPYMPPGTSTPSPHPQRAHARVELRGGVEDYLEAASELLAPGGRVVVCCDARRPERAIGGGAAAGLRALRRQDAVPRAGRPPLFSVFTFGHAEEHDGVELDPVDPFVARTAAGERTEAYFALRAFFGLPRAREAGS